MPIRAQSELPWDRPDIRFYGDNGATSLSALATDRGQYETNLTVGAGTDVVYEASPAARLAGVYPRTIAMHVERNTTGYLYAHGTAGEDHLLWSGSQYNVAINGTNAVVLVDPGGTELVIVVRSEANPATTGASDAVLTTLEIYDITNSTMHRAQGAHVAIPNPTADFAFGARDNAGTNSFITAGGTIFKIRHSSRAVAFTEIAQDWLLGLAESPAFVPGMRSLRDTVSGLVGTATGTTYDEDFDARDFDGVDDKLVYANPADLSGSPLTIALWVYHDTTSTTDTYVELQATIGQAILFSRRTTNSVRFTWNGSTQMDVHSSNGTAPSSGGWHHVAITGDGSTTAANYHIYVDGVEVGYQTQTNGVTLRNVDDEFTIGALLAGTDPLDGRIADLQIHAFELSAAAIAALAADPRYSTAAKLERQGVPLTQASGVGDQAEVHGAAVQWAASELRHAQWRCMGALMNWRMQTVDDIAGGYDDNAGTREKIKLAPGGTVDTGGEGFYLNLAWFGVFPVAPTCNRLWIEVHGRFWDSTADDSLEFGVQLYSFARKPWGPGAGAIDAADYSYVQARFISDEAAPGSWRIQATVPVHVGESGPGKGKTYLGLAYGLNLNDAGSGGRVNVNAVHAVQIFDTTVGQPPGGGPVGEAG